MAEHLTMRRATPEDYADVVNIISAFGGRDYMSADYYHMIKDPSFVGVVSEIQGQIVAFAGAYVINGGTTMMTKGSRVKERFQGQGIYGKLWKYLLSSTRENFPDIRFEEFSVNLLSPLLKVPVAERKYTELYRTPIKFFSLPDEIRQTYVSEAQTDGTIGVDELSTDVLGQALADSKMAATLFPRRLVVNRRVYQPVVENVEIIDRQTNYKTGSFSKEVNRTLLLIVFGSWFHCSGHLEYILDCYGRPPETVTLQGHVKRHIAKAMSLCDGEIRFMIFAEDDLSEALETTCNSLGLRKEVFFSTHLVVLARRL